ncbi:hypothetical protein AB4Y45_27820 [Paraburkholderia sp. EG287A]|uniref:hypothetical protein n=1 Tax=Paraburkholderia sp. EG287A TaxID=3237012 RepID=UPI0034D219E9
MLHKQNSWFYQHVLSVINRRPRYAERVARRVESIHSDIHQDDLFADVDGSEASSGASAEASVSGSGPASSDADSDGGDPDPDPSGPTLPESVLVLQRAHFRLTRTGVSGVRFDIPSATFRASFVSNGKPQRIGAFATINEAVIAIRDAYRAVEVSA